MIKNNIWNNSSENIKKKKRDEELIVSFRACKAIRAVKHGTQILERRINGSSQTENKGDDRHMTLDNG